jgi:hypothetical protein
MTETMPTSLQFRGVDKIENLIISQQYVVGFSTRLHPKSTGDLAITRFGACDC